MQYCESVLISKGFFEIGVVSKTRMMAYKGCQQRRLGNKNMRVSYHKFRTIIGLITWASLCYVSTKRPDLRECH